MRPEPASDAEAPPELGGQQEHAPRVHGDVAIEVGCVRVEDAPEARLGVDGNERREWAERFLGRGEHRGRRFGIAQVGLDEGAAAELVGLVGSEPHGSLAS
jgi:hypothetical protein